MAQFKITNITATFTVGCRVDRDLIAPNCVNVEFNRKKFNAAIIRFREPKATCLVFNSGAVTLIGANSLQNVDLTAKRLVDQLQKRCGYTEARVHKVEVRNIAASSSVGIRLDLPSLVKELEGSYEPELFSGLIVYIPNSRARVIVYSTGKIIATGCKNEADLRLVHNRVQDIIMLTFFDIK